MATTIDPIHKLEYSFALFNEELARLYYLSDLPLNGYSSLGMFDPEDIVSRVNFIKTWTDEFFEFLKDDECNLNSIPVFMEQVFITNRHVKRLIVAIKKGEVENEVLKDPKTLAALINYKDTLQRLMKIFYKPEPYIVKIDEPSEEYLNDVFTNSALDDVDISAPYDIRPWPPKKEVEPLAQDEREDIIGL